MSALLPCKTCKKYVSDTYETCPHCGENNPTGYLAIWLLSEMLLVFNVVAIAHFVFSPLLLNVLSVLLAVVFVGILSMLFKLDDDL